LRRKRFPLSTVLSVLLCASLVFTVEADAAMWSQTYGGTENDEGWSVVQTVDGGYAVAGYTNSYGAGAWDVWLIKTDTSGTAQWNQTYGGTDYDAGWSVVQTSDGGYAVAGYTNSYGAGWSDVWLVKTDASGTLQWNQTYGGTVTDVGFSVVETSDGGYAIAGYTFSYGAGSADVWLVKTDANGNEQWNQTYGGTSADEGYSVVETVDGGYAVAGYTTSYGTGSADVWLVKTDSAGMVQWNQTYGGTDYDAGWSVVQTSDGGYAVAGYTTSYGAGWSDVWLVKTDASGNEQWNQTYGGTDWDEGWSVVQTSDGGYAIAGDTTSYEYYVVWLVKTDASGTLQWNQTYGGTDEDVGRSVVETVDGGYAVAGYTDSFGAGGSDVWLIKTDEYGVVPDFQFWIIFPLLLIAPLFAVILKKKEFRQHKKGDVLFN
jgi:hypothetical protein